MAHIHKTFRDLSWWHTSLIKKSGWLIIAAEKDNAEVYEQKLNNYQLEIQNLIDELQVARNAYQDPDKQGELAVMSEEMIILQRVVGQPRNQIVNSSNQVNNSGLVRPSAMAVLSPQVASLQTSSPNRPGFPQYSPGALATYQQGLFNPSPATNALYGSPLNNQPSSGVFTSSPFSPPGGLL